MSDELKRIEQLEQAVVQLTKQVNYMALQLGFIQVAPAATAAGEGVAGQRQIAGNPNRTETGMGPLLNPTGSQYL